MTGRNTQFLQLSRRDIIVAAATAAVAPLTSAPLYSQAPAIARGFVFEDVEGTGLRTRSTTGIANVMVSNGLDVTLTARDGSWRLPVSAGDSLFVIKPSGWTTLQDRYARPQFSHLHHPVGSPAEFGSRFAGVAPTGLLPDSIDFALRRHDEPSRFDVLLTADTQPSNAEELGFVRDALLSRVPGCGAAFAIHHGDVMGDDLSLFERYVGMLGATGIPWHHCPGNHDMNTDASAPHLSFETWKRVFGPTHYAFQHGGATFIILNNIAPLGRAEAVRQGRDYVGLIGDLQLAFVANVLRHVPRDQLVVVSMHIPLVCFDDPTSASDNTSDRDRLLELLAGHPNAVSFAGHSHTIEHHYLAKNYGHEHHHHVLAAACGSWWSGPRDHHGIPRSDAPDGSPRGFHMLSIDGNRHSTRFVPGCDRGVAPMRLMLDGPLKCAPVSRNGRAGHPLSTNAVESTLLLVNVFDGGPRTRVWFDMPAQRQTPVELQRNSIYDPIVMEFFADHAATCKPWASAVRSSHIWTAALPRNLTPGIHHIGVRAVAECGSELVDDMLLEIAE